MKTMVRVLAAQILLCTSLFAANLVNVSGVSKAAIDGFDPVAFFTDSRPVNGSPFINATYQGAVYFFATEEHKASFEKSPEKYAPQFGGFCASGVGVNRLLPVDISTWQIHDGKLYLNLNADVSKQFNMDIDSKIARAEKNWPALVATNGK